MEKLFLNLLVLLLMLLHFLLEGGMAERVVARMRRSQILFALVRASTPIQRG